MRRDHGPYTPPGLLGGLYTWAQERAEGARFAAWAWMFGAIALFGGMAFLMARLFPHAPSQILAAGVVLAIAATCLLIGVVRTLRQMKE